MSFIKKREVFFISGYDPRGARQHYGLYKRELRIHEQFEDAHFNISSKRRTDTYVQSWTIEKTTLNKKTETAYHFLEWDDIIRKNWKKDILSIIFSIIYYVKIYILEGLFLKYARNFPRQMVALFSPFVYFLLSLTLGYGLFLLIFNLLHILMLSSLATAIGIVISFFFIATLLLYAKKIALFWLVQIYAFSGKYAHGYMEDIDERIEYFSTQIIKAIELKKVNKVDEVLIVVHSVGSILLIPLLNKVFDKVGQKEELSILVLGECIPLITVVPEAKIYRTQMGKVANMENLYWVDYTSVIDGACFPSLNYFEDSKIQIKKSENFHFLSTRFHTLFEKNRYKKLRKNKYIVHFLYFFAVDKENGYNFFKMTISHFNLRKSIPLDKDR